MCKKQNEIIILKKNTKREVLLYLHDIKKVAQTLQTMWRLKKTRVVKKKNKYIYTAYIYAFKLAFSKYF